MGRRRKQRPLESPQSIPEFIFKNRKRLNLSQEDFGRLLCVTRIAVHNWEKAISQPSFAHFELIRCFSKIEKVPDKAILKIALVSGGGPFALYLLLKSAFEEA